MNGLFICCLNSFAKRFRAIAIALLAASVSSGCSSAPVTGAIAPAAAAAAGENRVQAQRQERVADAVDDVEDDFDGGRSELGYMPITLNEEVRRWIDYFAVKDRERFTRFLRRGSVYRNLVEEMLESNGLPKELYFLAMIESGYRADARSHAAAVGVWQFIRGTGTRYGLTSDYYVDERRDPIRATRSAVRYLKDLYTVFQDWYLAMAAYNAGEMRVLGAVMGGNTRDFWALARARKLPRETRNYVPKFLAAAIIGRDPERFGIRGYENEEHPHVELVDVPSPVRLRDVALITGVSYDELRRFNPNIRRGVTPPNQSTYGLWVPRDEADRVRRSHASLHKRRMGGLASRRALASGKGSYHLVRRGETLTRIARRYGTSVYSLKRLNRLRGDRIDVGMRLKVRGKRVRIRRYRVRRGDSLFSIARRFGTSVSSLKRLNRIRGSAIYAGQRIKVASGSI